MEIDVLMKTTYIVVPVFATTLFIYWWSWFTAYKIHNRIISIIVFFAPVILIIVAGTYLILVNK